MTMSKLHQAARAYAQAGYEIFPCVAEDKVPACAGGFKSATSNLNQIDAWWAHNPNYNIGFSPGSHGILVIDLDPGAAPKEPLPETYTISTPRGGKHLWYIGQGPSTSNAISPHVDTRSIGGYVLLPPSRVVIPAKGISGDYSVENPASLTPAPSWVEAELARKSPVTANSGASSSASSGLPEPSGLEVDSPANIRRAEVRLKALTSQGRIAIQGAGGDSQTYLTACEVMDLGLSPEKALDLMARLWNPYCDPPWSYDDLARKVFNALSYRRHALGAQAVVGQPAENFKGALAQMPLTLPVTKPYFDPDDTDDDTDGDTDDDTGGDTGGDMGEDTGNTEIAEKLKKSEQYPVLSLDDLLARTAEPVQEIIPQLVEKNIVTFLSAPGGSHKSRLALQWLLCVATKTPVFGRTVLHASCLYLSYEDHLDEVTRRTQALAKRLNIQQRQEDLGHPRDLDVLNPTSFEYLDLTMSAPPLLVVTESGITPQPFFFDLRKKVLGLKGPKFIVLDSTYNALQFIGSAKINEGCVKASIEFLNRFCAETDSTIIALWHPSSAGQERGDASGWSVAWHNAPRARLSLSPVKDTKDAYELRVEKRNNGPKARPLTLHWSDGALLPLTEGQVAGRADALYEACIAAIILAAETGQPLQKQRKASRWILDKIEQACGIRPDERTLREQACLALEAGRLKFRGFAHGVQAGYYPPDDWSAEPSAESEAGDLSDLF